MELVETSSFPSPHSLPSAGAEGGEGGSACAFVAAISTLFQGCPLLGLWAFPFPSNYIITSQHAAGIVGEMGYSYHNNGDK